jgi:predicted alternative tryptophan synthase beta-subunit
MFGLPVKIFMVKVSYDQKTYRRPHSSGRF